MVSSDGVPSIVNRLRLMMFLRHGGQGFLFPYIAIYLTYSSGLSISAVGALFAAGAGLVLVIQPIIGQWADKVGSIKALRFVLAANCMLGFVLLSKSTVVLYIAVPFLYLFSKSSSVLLDAITVIFAETRFGRIRLFGSIGFAATVGFGGAMIGGDWQVGCAIAYIASYGATIFATVGLNMTSSATDRVGARFKRASLQDFIFFDARFFGVIGAISLTAMVVRSSESFFSIGMKEYGATGLLIGGAWMLHVVPEVIFLFTADKLANRFDPRKLLLIGTGAYILRFAILVASVDPWVWAGSQAFGAAAFSLWYVGTVRVVASASPIDKRATGQSIYAALSAGIGEIIGNAGGGLLVGKVGINAFYLGGTLCVALSLVILISLDVRKFHTSSAL